MIDLALLRIIKWREQFDKVYGYIPRSAIDKRTKILADDMAKYFKANPEEERIDILSFRSMFFTTWHKGMDKDSTEYYNGVIDRLEADPPESVKRNIINNLLELEFATDLANAVNEYEQGEEIDIVSVVDVMTKEVKESLERTTNFEYADVFDASINEENDDDGYEWPLVAMNNTYRRIQGGDLYIVAARPGKGKTTWLTQLNASMAGQMEPHKVIVWFNNESRRQRIMSRQIQSVLRATNSELQEYGPDLIRTKYIERMGRADRVRVYDVHGKSSTQLVDILESIGTENIGAIIFDMLDNVKFPTRREVREDQRLEQMYQWARELGVIYNCPVFPTSQVSNDGGSNPYCMFPLEGMLKDSKTGKQGACDGIIMIGFSEDPMKQNARYLSMPKTKSKRAGMPDLRIELEFDADHGVYKE